MNVPSTFTVCALIGAALLNGCEKAVFVEIPTQDRQLVVSGFFSPDSVWQINLSHSVDYSSLSDPRGVDGATVAVWTGGTLIDRLGTLGGGRYRSGRQPEDNQSFTLRVVADGFDPVEATGRTPRTIGPTSAIALPNDGITQFGSLSVPVELTLQDPAGAGDFYALEAGVTLRYRDAEGETHVLSRRSQFSSRDLVLREDDPFDTEEIWFDRALFNDKAIEGRSNTVKFTVRLFEIDPLFATGGQVTVDLFLMSITEDFYLHGKTVKLQQDLGASPFSEPVQIHSNTSNGLGIFAGYRVRKLSLPVIFGS